MIKIYTYSHNRPDFIEPQYNSLKKHIQDDFEFIVFNNERAGSNPFSGYSPDRVQEIFDVCERIGVECIRVDLDPQYQYINGYKQFEGDSFTGDGSQVCGYAFTWGWQHHISKNDCVSLIIDSDMFFIKDISITEMIQGYNLSFIPSYRYSRKYSDGDSGEIALRYPWNGIVIADVPNLPNPSELKWDLGIFNGQPCDVGGGGPSVGEDSIIRTNGTTINETLTVGPSANGGVEFTNGFSAGPIQVSNGNTVTVENGAQWFILGGEDNDVGEGQIMQMRYSQTPATRYLIQAQNLSPIPNLEVTIQPSHTNSKILLMAMINSNARHVTSFGFLRNNGTLTSGLSGNTNVGSGSVATTYHNRDTGGDMFNTMIQYMDMPNTTNPCTYSVGVSASWGGGTRDLYINDRDSNDMRSISSLAAYEIRG